jgi:hypothetical protein
MERIESVVRCNIYLNKKVFEAKNNWVMEGYGSSTDCPTDYDDDDAGDIAVRWKKNLTHGSQVIVLDCREKWCHAKILKRRLNAYGDLEFKVHFFGWNARWDEWVSFTSCRIRPMSSKNTLQLQPPPRPLSHHTCLRPVDLSSPQPSLSLDEEVANILVSFISSH